ncbi:MAG TPA: sulfatase-like hydrolase/transferase [Solirubrobacteraceae bacterium]|nr:sulfatase-like hydrolase/transferase [Solirubrobacteraceae bacterium]
MPASRPHILLLVLDAARRDALAPYDPSAATPTFAALARRGVAIEHAYATASWTLPSHVAMFTGELAGPLGLDQAPGGDPRSVAATLAPRAERLLAARLAAAGYATHGLSANLWVSPHSGLDAGFASFDYVASARLDGAVRAGAGRLRAGLTWAREGLRARDDDGARELGRRLARMIGDCAPQTPQFWFVNLVEAHSPYLPPRPYDDLPARARVAAARDCARLLTFESICVAAAGGLALPAEVMARLAHLHRRCVVSMDSWLAGVLALLRRRGMLDDTLVIVTSDHGESFGEAGRLAHGFGVGDELIRVPLIAAGPGAEHFAETTGALSLRELPGRIARAAGLAGDLFGPPGDGIAMARAAAICPPDDPRMVAFAERWSLSPAQVRRLAADRWAVSDGTLTVRGGDDDPRPPALPGHLAAAAAMVRSAAGTATPAALDAAAPAAATLGGAVAGDAGLAGATEDPAVADLERQMRLLGYM